MVETPNFKSGVGRLTTDRFDFQKHVNGEQFNHFAPTILLDPVFTVDGSGVANVQEALQAINALVPQVIPDATTSVKGLIQLSGDLAAGSATSPVVTGLRGFPIQNTAPTTGYVLTWSGTSWVPQALTSTFSSLTVNGLTSLNSTVSMTGLVSASGAVIISGSLAVSTPDNITLTTTVPSTDIILTATRDIDLIATDDIHITASGGASSDIIINAGRNLNLIGASSINVDATGGGMIVDGTVSFNSGVNIGNTSSDDLVVAAIAAFNADVTLGNALTDLILIKGTIGNSSNDMVIAGALRFTGTAGRVLHSGVLLNNANQTISVLYNKYLKVPSTVSATRTYTLNPSAAAQDGDWFKFYNESAFTQIITGVYGDFVNPNGQRSFCRIGGTWQIVETPT